MEGGGEGVQPSWSKANFLNFIFLNPSLSILVHLMKLGQTKGLNTHFLAARTRTKTRLLFGLNKELSVSLTESNNVKINFLDMTKVLVLKQSNVTIIHLDMHSDHLNSM